MTRGVAHPPELRAQVVAAVLAGSTQAQAAAEFGVDVSVVSRWVNAGLQPIAIEKKHVDTDTELVMTYFRSAVRAMIVQANVFADEQYCRIQEADKLAIAHGVLGDKFVLVAAAAQALGLITAPASSSRIIDQPALDSPRASEST
jgi:hypothetical protein